MTNLNFSTNSNFDKCKKCGRPAVKLIYSLACDYCDFPENLIDVYGAISVNLIQKYVSNQRSEFISYFMNEEILVSFSEDRHLMERLKGPGSEVYRLAIRSDFDFSNGKILTEEIYGRNSLLGREMIYTASLAYDVEHGKELLKKYEKENDDIGFIYFPVRRENV